MKCPTYNIEMAIKSKKNNVPKTAYSFSTPIFLLYKIEEFHLLCESDIVLSDAKIYGHQIIYTAEIV